MNAEMEKNTIRFDQSLLAKAIENDPRYKRSVNGAYELVNYDPNSTLRFFVNYIPDSYPTHWHPATELIMPVENHYTVTVRETTYDLRPGDILIIPPGELHTLTAPPTGIRLIYMFDLAVLSKIRGFSYLTAFMSQPTLITPENNSAIYEEETSLLLDLMELYMCDDNLRDLTIYAKLIRFFVCFSQHHIDSEGVVSPTSRHPDRRKHLLDTMNTVFDYLDDHYDENLTLEKVADVAGFSKYHFSRLFKQCSGYNFYDYLCHRRIKSAEGLLMNSDLPITEIALQSGFSSLSSFNRTFKKLKSCTPSEYRNLISTSHTCGSQEDKD